MKKVVLCRTAICFIAAVLLLFLPGCETSAKPTEVTTKTVMGAETFALCSETVKADVRETVTEPCSQTAAYTETAATEAPTESETEAVTEGMTEAETEKETETAVQTWTETEALTEAAVVRREAKDIVEELVVDYAEHGSSALKRIPGLIGELYETDANLGVRFEKIMDIWTSPDLGKPINYGVLPDGLPDTDELCIVVLGYTLEKDGSMKDELIGRLNVALRSAEKYPNAYILCSGGGTAGNDKTVTEASQMAAWLKDHGVDPKRIIVEDTSNSTCQNAVFAYDVLLYRYYSVKKLAIVSSDYHIPAATLIFSAESVLRAPVPGDEKLQVVSNAAYEVPGGVFRRIYCASALLGLFGEPERAIEIE
ncbi:MAG: YdcF family protein [Clostridia bacterium]|nr:YdcF family protein [Clostridia bacterium]